MLVLFESAAGYAIFKVSTVKPQTNIKNNATTPEPNLTFARFQLLDDKKLSQLDNIYEEFESPEKASRM